MKISAITCCVGEGYARHFEKSLPIWLDTLDQLTVVTKPDDKRVLDLLSAYSSNNLRSVTTDVFTQHGASFNKGAALCEGYRYCNPVDWVLCCDSDITPAPDWRIQVERACLEPGQIYGAWRYNHDGHQCDKVFFPFGYFQLWNVADPNSWQWPLFDTWHAHAGCYDANFCERWLVKDRIQLPIELTHEGERRKNWFGETEAGFLKMHSLFARGVKRYRKESNAGKLRLPIPKPDIRLSIRKSTARRTLAILGLAREFGPFRVQAKLSHLLTSAEWKEPWVAVDLEDSLQSIREKIFKKLFPSY